jgi:UDP-glucose 4-epimerase
MKILVVGGNGFLGKEITKQLLDDGYKVMNMNRSGDAKLSEAQLSADIGKPDSYMSFIDKWKPEVVVDCAWVTVQKTYRESLENYDYTAQTLQFATHCFAAGSRHFIGLGSSAEYGSQSSPCNAAVTIPKPVDAYGENKFETFLKLHELSESVNARLTWGRVFQPYGPGQDSERLIPWAVQRLLSGQEVKLQNPNLKLDWISSRDIARAVSWSIKHVTPEVIDIGTSIGTSVCQVLNKVARIVGGRPELIKPLEDIQPQQSEFSLIVSPDSPLLQGGWKPKDTLQSGLLWAVGR